MKTLALSLSVFALEKRTFDAVAECRECGSRIKFKAVKIYNEWNKTWELKTSSLWIPAYCGPCSEKIQNDRTAMHQAWAHCQTKYGSYCVGPAGERRGRGAHIDAVYRGLLRQNANMPAPVKHGQFAPGCGIYGCHGDLCKKQINR